MCGKSGSKPGKIEFANHLLIYQCKPNNSGLQNRESAQFVFRNVGSRPVRILSVHSDCGCTVASVQPTRVEPGMTGLLQAMLKPPEADIRDVRIEIETDSPENPETTLLLRMIASRKPPYFYNTTGNLYFRAEDIKGEPREFSVIMVERGAEPAPPMIQCNLPFVNFIYKNSTKTSHILKDRHKQSYQFDVVFTNDVPEDDFSGEIEVVDPNNKQVFKHIAIAGWPVPEIAVSPNRVMLQTPMDGKSNASELIVVRTKRPMARFESEFDSGSDSKSGITIEAPEVSPDRKSASFRVKGDSNSYESMHDKIEQITFTATGEDGVPLKKESC